MRRLGQLPFYLVSLVIGVVAGFGAVLFRGLIALSLRRHHKGDRLRNVWRDGPNITRIGTSRTGNSQWLVNRGLTGGPYGVGERVPISVSRAIVSAVLDGSLSKIRTRREAVFGLEVPVECPGVPEKLLDLRKTWADPSRLRQEGS